MALNLRADLRAQYPWRVSEKDRTDYSYLFRPMDDQIAPSTSFDITGALDSPRSLCSFQPSVAGAERTKEIHEEFEGFRMNSLVTEQDATSRIFKERVRQIATSESFHDHLQASGVSSCTTSILDQMCSGMSSSFSTSPLVPPDVPDMTRKLTDSNSFPSKQDSPNHSAEDSDTDLKGQGTKRRKPQQKRIVCVPIGPEGKQKGETPPSDLWAWRKYGQKPIKGSPYPRGYYRCSSSKGCSARKQVERSRSDPSTLIITYTADHNHPWPANRNSSAASTCVSSPEKLRSAQSQSQDERACEPSENLFSSIINSSNAVDEQVVSPLDSMQVEESLNWQRDVNLCMSRSKVEMDQDDFFADLGELPELAAIFKKEILEERSSEEIRNRNMQENHSIFSWSASSCLLLENKVMS